MENDRRRIIIAIIVIGLGMGVFVIRTILSHKSKIVVRTQTEEATEVISEETDPSYEKSDMVPVYICGAVSMPGIYEVSVPVYLFEVIDMAGGLTTEADAESIDLVYVVESAMSIYIPSLGEEDAEPHGFLGKELGMGRIDEPEPSQDGLININTADVSLLMTLPGIGEKTAAAIVQYREESGAFQAVEDIKKVSGIGEAKYAQIRDLICV